MNTAVRQRTIADTPVRWQAAIKRADAEGVTVRQLQCGVWVATSGTDANGAYIVTPTGCECRAAAEGDPICKHRAALRLRLGLLAVEVEPAPIVREVIVLTAPDDCQPCEGRGYFRKESRIFTGTTFRANCIACKGTGKRDGQRIPQRATA